MVPHAVHRIGRAQVREFGLVPHLEVDDLHPDLAGSGQDLDRGTHGLLNARDVDPGAIEHATLGYVFEACRVQNKLQKIEAKLVLRLLGLAAIRPSPLSQTCYK